MRKLLLVLSLGLGAPVAAPAQVIPTPPAATSPVPVRRPLPGERRNERAAPDTLISIIGCGTDSLRPLCVAAVLFAGNAVTREQILRAELDFREGDSLTLAGLAARLEANRSRLFNLQLFHNVRVQATCRAGQLTVLFGLEERWYLFPLPIFSLADRNFNAWLDRPDRWRRFDYGLRLVRYNFRGRNERLSLTLQQGFNRRYDLFYDAPGFGLRRRVGVGMGFSYFQSRTLDYTTRADRLAAYRSETSFPVQRLLVTAGLRLRSTVQFTSALDFSYQRQQISDSVRRLNPDYYLNGRLQREFVEVIFTSTRNQRRTFAYPLSGQYVQLQLSHRRFLDRATPPSSTLRLRYARYQPLGRGFYSSTGLTGQTRISRRLAYPDRRALGYEALVRGYDAYVIEGQHFLLAQQGLSYELLSARTIRLPGLRDSKFGQLPLALYLNIFADGGYVAAPTPTPENQLPNSLLGAAGLGLHFVTYYDRVFVVEYTRNGRGETGFFLRTSFPI
ncbi:POTRA domain-containing protein [uncultured Hymenobacter sp.]|uniref:POTRA domain-containing protein n=1 Tax=uncultured Hymenobacter sp. TaxID=170016 RepID=UPI0035CAE8AC